MTAIADLLTSDDQAPGELETLLVGPHAQWFAIGDLHVNLARRKPLARLLWALVMSAETDREGMTTMELIAAGWPGERLVRNAGRIRLRVAVATLRTMGLVTRLVTTPAGYAIAGPLAVQVSESIAPPSAVEVERAEAS